MCIRDRSGTMNSVTVTFPFSNVSYANDIQLSYLGLLCKFKIMDKVKVEKVLVYTGLNVHKDEINGGPRTSIFKLMKYLLLLRSNFASFIIASFCLIKNYIS